MEEFLTFVVICIVLGVLVAGGFCLYYGGGWCLAAALAVTFFAAIFAALVANSGKREKTAWWCAGIFALLDLVLFAIMAAKGVSSTVFVWLFWIFLVAGIVFAMVLGGTVDDEERKKKEAAEERKRQEEELRKQEEERIKQGKAKNIAELCSCILLPDTCFLMDLGHVSESSRSSLANDFILWFEAQCKKCSHKVTLHRHVYQEIQRLYNGEDRKNSKKAQGAKKLIERWQKLGIIQTYPDLEDKEKSYYADDALLKYMEELLQKGEKVRLLTNDLDLRIRARDRFEKLGKALPEDMLLSLDDILAKWPR